MEISRENHHALLKEVCNGDENALEYLEEISKIFKIWDDLYDQDTPVSKEEINDSFSNLAFNFGRNPFFKANREILESFVFLAWNSWMDSNEWKGSEDQLKGMCAWFIRDLCNDVDILVAWLVGGVEHARKMSLKCREFYLKQLRSRGLDGFIK